MSTSTRRARLAATAAVLALGTVPLLAAGGTAAASPTQADAVRINLLAINDFHGNLEKIPSSSSSGRINSTPAGGAEYLASHLDELREKAAADDIPSITVAAGDLIGASPLLSAAFHDEPTIEALSKMGLQVASVGNHEFDEGYKELLRMQNGGCLPDGPDGANNQNSCPDSSDPFTGATFHYLSANVKYTGTDRTVFPGTWVKKVHGVNVGFIGMTLKETPEIVTKSGVEGLTFTDEVQTADAAANALDKAGVKTIVVLLHQGAVPSDPTQYDGCAGVDGPGLTIAKNLSSKIDVVVSGHTHQAYNCTVTDPAGQPRLFTSGSSYGRLITQIHLKVDPRTKDVERGKTWAKNLIVTNSDGTPARSDITSLIAKFNGYVAGIKNRVLGQIAPADTKDVLSRTPDADGDSPLGNLIADSQLADASTVHNGKVPVVALMNPGGIRADLVEDDNKNVTFGAAFTVQPFNNYVVSLDLTGQQLLDVLNQQWNGRNEGTVNNKILQVAGLSYTYSKSAAAATGADALVPGSVKVDLDHDGTPEAPVVATDTYRVVVNSFLSDGGDGFATLAQGTDKYYGGLDIDALASYLSKHSPYQPVPTDRVTSVS